MTAPGGDRALPRWIRELGDAGPRRSCAATHRQPTLDDVFLALTGRSLREEAASGADPAEDDTSHESAERTDSHAPRAPPDPPNRRQEHDRMNTISPAATTVTANERPAASARPTGFVHDTVTVFARELPPVVRDPFSVIFCLVQPLVFLGLFGPLLIGASGGDAAGRCSGSCPASS